MNQGWDLLRELWDRATGGADVAAEPSSHGPDDWPTGPRAAGMQEAIEWFADGIETRSVPTALFLVGGPGVGKSHAAGEVAKQFVPVDELEDGLSHRSYKYTKGQANILVVNDATISDSSTRRAALAADVAATISSKSHLLACVNRGVLVEENSAIKKDGYEEDTAGRLLVSWLHDVRKLPSDTGNFNFRNLKTRDYIAVVDLYENETLITNICVVFADVCSLLEPRPSVKLKHSEDGTIELKATRYRVTPYNERSLDALCEIPAGALLAEFCSRLEAAFEGEELGTNAVTANIYSLLNPNFQLGFLNVLRAAEIISGQKFSYRELWGVFVRAVVGNLPEQIHRLEATSELGLPMKLSPEVPVEFSAWKSAAGLRLGQSIFGPGEPAGQDLGRNPVTRIMWGADPARDALPGRFDPKVLGGWADPVVEAFAAQGPDGSPLHALLFEQLSDDDPFSTVVTAFDRALDAAYTAAVSDDGPTKSTPAQRREYTSWYGRYLSRLYALANGIPAFRNEVVMWTTIWNVPGELPTEIGTGLSTLLAPSRSPGNSSSKSFIPVFDSRTSPIRGHMAAAKLAISASDLTFSSRVQGESIFLILEEKSKDIAEMALDLAMLREAMTAAEDHPGVTELTDITAPRLERLRAARLVPDKLRASTQFVAIRGDDEVMFSVPKEIDNG